MFYFVVFPIVGAIIGALTNQIAIKMLFRPYQAWRLGRWRLPMTPGVIPQNRHIIAGNIAQTFEKKLLSGDELHQFITGDKARAAVSSKVDEMAAFLGPFAGMLENLKPKIVAKILDGIEEMATQAMKDSGELNIGRKIEDKINAMDIAQLEDLILGFSRREFRHITIFGGVLGAIIGVVQATLTVLLNT